MALLAAAARLILPAYGNTPGGGSGGANVTLSSNGTAATLSNGVITVVITESTGQATSMTYNGVQTVSNTSGSSNIYFSMDGGSTFFVPGSCVFTTVVNTTDMVEVSFKHTYNPSDTSTNNHPVDVDIHWVLRRGATGPYVYVILDHPASYPDLNIGEWRMVWQLPHTSETFTFEREYVDNFRHHDMPTYYEFAHPVILSGGNSTRIAEIELLPSSVPGHAQSTRAGTYNCKYEFSQEYQTFGAWGHASDVNHKGVWIIPGSLEFFNDGPTKQDLIIAESYSLIHFGRNHYGGSTTVVASGTAWSKVYGPYLLYCNSASSADACWTDAQAQAVAEQGAWPYSWFAGNTTLYPLAAARGTVSGNLIITDPLKPAVSSANAWVGLATPDGTPGYDWQNDSLNYEYWTRADANGNFTIRNVRPGTYTLYAFNDGVTGQYSQAGVTVTAGQTLALGNITWTIVHPGNWIAWEIGVPDRNATEFRHGQTDYYIPYVWTDFSNEFTNPLNFNIGSSNWASDWNYAHDFWQIGGNASTVGNLSLWPWNINFNLDSVPASGNAVLTIAFAGEQSGHLRIWVNRALTSNPNFDFTSFSGPAGNSLLRESIHTKYEVHTFNIAVSNLHTGANTITLEQINGSLGEGNHLMYDYLNLEMPGTAPATQPAVGRAFTWLGGNGNNSWDIGTFINWTNSGGNATFNQGDVVTFDDSGSSSPSIILNGALEPNGVTITGTQNYTFTGSGCITGTTSLTKTGTGTLTLSNIGVNSYTGNTTVSGGVIQLNAALSNSGNVVVQSGGTLAVGANLTTGTVTVNSGGTLEGVVGNITGNVVNNGTFTLANGGTYAIHGSVTNAGTMRVTNGTALAVTGAFVNNGVLDIITGSQSLPAGFVNNGVVLDAGSVRVQDIAVGGGVVQITAQSYAGHNYQLQWSPSLSPAAWQDVGAAQAGTGGVLTFTDTSSVPVGPSFYRVQVAP